MNCPNCGYQHPGPVTTCQRCGFPFPQQPLQPAVQPASPAKPVSDIGYFIIGSLLFVNVLVTLMVWFERGQWMHLFRSVLEVLLYTGVWVMLIVFVKKPVFRILNIIFGSLCFIFYLWSMFYRYF